MKLNTLPAVKSATRAIDVLELVANAAGPLSFADISSRLGIPNSSLFYLINTLVQRGYLQQENTRGYLLGPAVSRLASAINAPVSWVEAVEPLVQQVWSRVQETTAYMERRGDEIECLISKLAPHSLLPVHRVGERAPLYVFSGGKIVLADFEDEVFEAYLKRTHLRRLTPHTLTSAGAIRHEIGDVRSTGIAISREEHSLGIVGISVGLKAAAALVGTLGVAIPAVRLKDRTLAKIKSELTAAAMQFGNESMSRSRPVSRSQIPGGHEKVARDT